MTTACSKREENSLRRCRTAPWCDTAQNYDACPAGYIGSKPSALALVFLRADKFTVFGRLELEWCERKILLGWLELELVAGVV